MEIILWAFLMCYQIFLPPQVKWSAIISTKQGVYELPHELPNDLRLSRWGGQFPKQEKNRLRILGNKENQENLETC